MYDMASHSKEEVFSAIEEQLQEHKIVTFKWLSRTLKLHNTIAKQYLLEFIKKEPKNEYIVTYTVFGKKENGELLLMLTKATDEDHFKNKNISVIDKYVYSVQQSDSTFDPAMIYNIDKATYELQQMSLSSINYHTEIIRKDPRVARASSETNTKSENLNGSTATTKNEVRRVSPRKKSTEPPKTDFFRRISPRKKDVDVTLKEKEDKTSTNEKTSEDYNSTKSNSTKKLKPTKSTVNNGSITNFFSKGPVKKEIKEEDKSAEVKEVEETMAESKPAKPEKIINENVKQEPKSKKKEETKNKQKPSKKETAKRKGKQMKRVILMLDSDSDEEANNSDSNIDDNFEPEPEPEPEPQPIKETESEARVKVIDNKKRKRKVIEKQELDDEGFMHTTKEVVYESCDSEDEPTETVDPDKNTQSNSSPSAPPEKKAKTEPAIKKKQSSILSYFQAPSQKSKA